MDSLGSEAENTKSSIFFKEEIPLDGEKNIKTQDLTEADFAARTLNRGRCIVILGQSRQTEAVAVVERIEDVHRRRLHGIQTTYSTAQFPVRQGAPFPLPCLTCRQKIRKKKGKYYIIFSSSSMNLRMTLL